LLLNPAGQDLKKRYGMKSSMMPRWQMPYTGFEMGEMIHNFVVSISAKKGGEGGR